MPHVFSNADLSWKGDALHAIGRRGAIVTIEPDAKYPGMWRVRSRDGSLSDMVNRTRAKDAARSIAMAFLNTDIRPTEQG